MAQVATCRKRHSWADGGGIQDDGKPNPIPEPQLFAPYTCTIPPGPDRVEVLALRHQLKTSLWHTADATMSRSVDYVSNLVQLGYAIQEAALAERGIRWGADGVKLVPGDDPGDPPRWRAQIWDPSANGGKGGHIHLGYADERADAVDLIVKWYRRYCGLDVRVEPPEWFRELVRDAISIQAEASEREGGLAWDLDS